MRLVIYCYVQNVEPDECYCVSTTEIAAHLSRAEGSNTKYGYDILMPLWM